MKTLQARSRSAGPDEHVLTFVAQSDIRATFLVRAEQIDGSLRPVASGVNLVVRRSGVEVASCPSVPTLVLDAETGLHQAVVPFRAVRGGESWQLDHIDEHGVRTTHARGTFSFDDPAG